jgi:hypothetical protein
MKNRTEELLDSLRDGATNPARRAASQQETNRSPASRPRPGGRLMTPAQRSDLTRALLSGCVGDHRLDRMMESLD